MPAVGATGNPVESWDGLRERLRDSTAPISEIDVIWVWLIERSRAHGQDATLVCACLAEPMLARTVSTFATPDSTRRHDIESEVLTGFIGHLEHIELARPWILERLRWAAYRAAAAAHRQESVAASVADIGHDLDPIGEQALAMVSPPGHPETVLAQAVAARVITEAAAELIAVSRWERRTLTSLAAEREQSVVALRKRRRRAEHALRAWLTEHTHDSGQRAPAVSTPVSLGCTESSPRRARRPGQDSAPPENSPAEHGEVPKCA
ncbi:hypothetical protein V7968_02555 [Nocardia vulneris]|uniref:hypothetical protein n=1 Tax=Nocardia vulneris TaxID=1141657 RepID=UPI0030CDC681